jgi:hypothetical protein
VYEADGNYPSEDYFEVNATNGLVTLKRDIKTDYLQLTSYTVSHL